MASWAATWVSIVGRDFRAQQYPFGDEGFVRNKASSSMFAVSDVTAAEEGGGISVFGLCSYSRIIYRDVALQGGRSWPSDCCLLRYPPSLRLHYQLLT